MHGTYHVLIARRTTPNYLSVPHTSCHRIFPIQRAYVLDRLTRDLIRKRSITSCALSPHVRPDGNSRRIELRWDRRFARFLNPTEPGFSHMNENALRRIGIPADDSRLPANWRAVHAFNRVTSNQIN